MLSAADDTIAQDDHAEDDGRVDRDGRYVTFATMTGSIPQCRDCGALVGDKAVHDVWHDQESRRLLRAIAKGRQAGRLARRV